MSIIEKNFEQQLIVFPNPADNIVNVELKYIMEIDASFVIYDISGRKVKEAILKANQQMIELSISDLQSGLYYYEVQSGCKIDNSKGKLIITD